MDFAKFVAMLEAKGLFFPSATLLGDAFEGSVSKENLRQRPGQISETVDQFRTAVPNFDSAADERMRQSLELGFAVRSGHLEWQRSWTYISCWHMNDRESAAMWRLYAAGNQAIAVRSTFGRFKDCLSPHRRPPHAEPILGTVYYADYDSEIVRRNVHLAEFFYKRRSFAYENELRAVFQDLPLIPGSRDASGNITDHRFDVAKPPIPGRLLPLDLDLLVEEIYVAPSAPAWLRDVTDGVVKKYGLDKAVRDSALDGTPVY